MQESSSLSKTASQQRQQEGDAVAGVSGVVADGDVDDDSETCEDRKTHQTISSDAGEAVKVPSHITSKSGHSSSNNLAMVTAMKG